MDDWTNVFKAKWKAIQNTNATNINQLQIQNLAPKVFIDKSVPTTSTVNYPNGSNNMNKKSYGHPYLVQQQQMLLNKLKMLDAQSQKEQTLLLNAQSRMKGGLLPTEGPISMMHNLSSGLDSHLMPGNVGDINRVVWPFWFTTTQSDLDPNQAVQGNITITQEAAFILLSYTKAVFIEDNNNPGNFSYVDPNQPDSSGKSNGLTFVMRDSQSSREFMNTALDINQVGHWKYPTVLPTPQLFLPNSNLEFTFQNNTQNTKYTPFITMFGLRVRIDHAQDILSTLQG